MAGQSDCFFVNDDRYYVYYNLVQVEKMRKKGNDSGEPHALYTAAQACEF